MAVTAVASTTSSVLLLTAHADRPIILENSDANRLYVLLGPGTASSSNFSFSLAQNENAYLPSGYTGEVNAVWAGDGSGYAHISNY